MCPGISLAVLSALLWVASFFITTYRQVPPGPDFTLTLWYGELSLTTGGTYASPGLNALHSLPMANSLSRLLWWPADGWFRITTFGSGTSYWTLRVPLWTPFTLGFLIAAAAFPCWRSERRRLRLGLCRSCDYDRSGLTGPCPECGAVPLKA